MIKPFTMYILAWLFLKVVFKALIPSSLSTEYLAGAVLLGAAPCTAMVFVWSYLSDGDAGYTLILSVVLFVVIPLSAGALTRSRLIKHKGKEWFESVFLKKFDGVTEIGLLLTLVILFAFQGETILNNPLDIVLIAVPLIIQTYLIFAIGYLWCKAWKVPYEIAAPAGMIGASNFFELSVAVAISLFALPPALHSPRRWVFSPKCLSCSRLSLSRRRQNAGFRSKPNVDEYLGDSYEAHRVLPSVFYLSLAHKARPSCPRLTVEVNCLKHDEMNGRQILSSASLFHNRSS